MLVPKNPSNVSSHVSYSLGAGWIHFMLGPPLRNYWINIMQNTVESISAKPAYASASFLGADSHILPAMVNAHTHLELSQLPYPLDVSVRSMPCWVDALLAFRRSAEYNAEQGIRKAMGRHDFIESTIAAADIVPSTLNLNVMDSFPITWLPYAELIAWRCENVNETWFTNPGIFGFSPHAPQTVCPELLEQVIRQNRPIAMHLAETQEELQLLSSRTGPLLDMMRKADAEYNPKKVLLGKSPMDYLKVLAAAPQVLIIHGNYLNDAELRFLAEHRETMSVVYCPQSHHYFRHSSYPLRKMLDFGVNVLLGTDSAASAPQLSLLQEIRQVFKLHPRVLPEEVFRSATISAASALHLPKEFGTIQPGSPAKFAVLKE